MRIGALSVRARLTLWHAGVLTLVICVFAGGVLLFVRARLYRALDDQIRADLATVDRVYREETADLGELPLRMETPFELPEGPTVTSRTPHWPPVGGAPFRQSTLPHATHRLPHA